MRLGLQLCNGKIFNAINRRVKDTNIHSRMPARFELPHVHPLGDFCLVMGCEVPLIFICVAFPEMRRLVIIRSVVVVEQFEGREPTLYVRGQWLWARNRGMLQTWKFVHLTCCVNQPSGKRLKGDNELYSSNTPLFLP